MSFSAVLTQNQIMESVSLDPKISNSTKTFEPKISYGHPRMFNVRVIPLGTACVLKYFDMGISAFDI